MLVNCLSKLDMLKKLDEKVEGLDVHASSFKPLFIFLDKEGASYNCQTAQDFVKEVNNRFGDVLGGSTRTIGKRKFVLEFLDGSVKPTPQAGEMAAPEVIPEVEQPEPELVEKLDIEFAKSLEDGKSKKKAKDALADYAQKYEINLQKNKSFADMIVDLEEATSA